VRSEAKVQICAFNRNVRSNKDFVRLVSLQVFS